MKKENKVYVINSDILEKLEEIIAALQCVFLDIYSNYEALTKDKN